MRGEKRVGFVGLALAAVFCVVGCCPVSNEESSEPGTAAPEAAVQQEDQAQEVVMPDADVPQQPALEAPALPAEEPKVESEHVL